MSATLNLNGDYLSDALAAQVGGIGIAPGANINYVTGHAVFEATHGTAPKYAGLDKVNPGSVILSGEMMLRYMGWNEAADAIIAAMDKAIAEQARHLRLRPPDGRRDRSEVQRVRRQADRSDVTALARIRLGYPRRPGDVRAFVFSRSGLRPVGDRRRQGRRLGWTSGGVVVTGHRAQDLRAGLEIGLRGCCRASALRPGRTAAANWRWRP